jgi:sulfur-carrier protein adenylyltransferase/sulfurtransferase
VGDAAAGRAESNQKNRAQQLSCPARSGESAIMAMPEFKQLVDEVKRDITEIPAQALRQMQEANEKFLLIDVRQPEDWQQGVIPGAVKLSRGVLELNIDQLTTDKERKIVVYCNGGSCSALAAHSLQRMGFRNVHSLAGGYNGWKASER